MQPGSQPVMGELNTVEDAVGDERFGVPARWFHQQENSLLCADLAALMTASDYGVDITNRASHALVERGAAV